MARRRRLLGSGVLAGAALMFWLDPIHGRRRRHLARDQAQHWRKVLRHRAGSVQRDLEHRLRGLVARILTEPAPADDGVILRRVRSELGRYVSHPGAVRVGVNEGEVTLSGPIFTVEVPRLVRAMEQVPGVRRVVTALTPHDAEDGVPALQGRGPARASPLWPRSPALDAIGCLAGGAVVLAALPQLARPRAVLMGGAALLFGTALQREIEARRRAAAASPTPSSLPDPEHRPVSPPEHRPVAPPERSPEPPPELSPSVPPEQQPRPSPEIAPVLPPEINP